MEEELIESVEENVPGIKDLLTDLFVSNGIGLQALVTISLVGVLFAAWKAPKWVRKIGLTAPVICVIAYLPSIIRACIDCLAAGPISPTVIFEGARVFIFTLCYGFIIYLIAVVIELVQNFKQKGKVKTCGQVALILSIIYFLTAMSKIIGVLPMDTNDRPMEIAVILLPAAKILLIGLIIYLLSVILRIVQSPRI